MKTSTITSLLIAGTVAAGLIGMIGPQLVQSAFAQGGASSTGASTDFGSAGSSASANSLTGGSTSSSTAGLDVDCASEGVTPASECIATR
jgi:hypothetical protein